MIFQFARDAYYRTNIYNRMLRRHGPAQIYGLATDPIPGDPARGAGMLDGAMVLAARRRMLGDHIFENDIRSTAALTDLYGFPGCATFRRCPRLQPPPGRRPGSAIGCATATVGMP